MDLVALRATLLDRVSNMDEQTLRRTYYQITSINDIFSADVVQHILSFNTNLDLYTDDNAECLESRMVCKHWNQLNKLSERKAYRDLLELSQSVYNPMQSATARHKAFVIHPYALFIEGDFPPNLSIPLLGFDSIRKNFQECFDWLRDELDSLCLTFVLHENAGHIYFLETIGRYIGAGRTENIVVSPPHMVESDEDHKKMQLLIENVTVNFHLKNGHKTLKEDVVINNPKQVIFRNCIFQDLKLTVLEGVVEIKNCVLQSRDGYDPILVIHHCSDGIRMVSRERKRNDPKTKCQILNFRIENHLIGGQDPSCFAANGSAKYVKHERRRCRDLYATYFR